MPRSLVFAATLLGLVACKKGADEIPVQEVQVAPRSSPTGATAQQPKLKVPAPPAQGSPDRPVLFGHVNPKENPPPPQEQLPPPKPRKLPEHHPLLGPKDQPDNSAYIRENYE